MMGGSEHEKADCALPIFTFIAEANEGKGMKVKQWMKPLFQWVVPAAILFIYIYGMATFKWK